MLRLDYMGVVAVLSNVVVHCARSYAYNQGNLFVSIFPKHRTSRRFERIPSVLAGNPSTLRSVAGQRLRDGAQYQLLSRHNFRQLIRHAKIFFVNILSCFLMFDTVKIRHYLLMLPYGNNVISRWKEYIVLLLDVLA